MQIIETITRGKETLNIYIDPDPMNPREVFDNLGLFVTPKSHIGDTKEIPNKDSVALQLDVYMLMHSGMWLRVEKSFSDIDPGEWDSGLVGWMCATKEAIREGFGVKKITKKTLEKVKEALVSEIDTYGKYLNGEVYMYEILDEDMNIKDSCCGYYSKEDILDAVGWNKY
jgi:hypothetical protein